FSTACVSDAGRIPRVCSECGGQLIWIDREGLGLSTQDRHSGDVKDRRCPAISLKRQAQNFFFVGHHAVGAGRLRRVERRQAEGASERDQSLTTAIRHRAAPRFLPCLYPATKPGRDEKAPRLIEARGCSGAERLQE